MRRALRTSLVVLLALIALVAFGWATSWRSPAFYPLAESRALPAPVLTLAEYDAVHATFPRPYVVACTAGDGRVILFGATHTRDARHPEIAELRRRFAELAPTVALVEGRPGGPFVALRDAIAVLGEGGEVMRLARAAGVPVWSWEMPREVEVAAQLARFHRERVALFYVLRPYVSERRFGRPADPDAGVESVRRERTRWPGLEGTLPDVAAIDAIWRRDFAGLPDWRDTSDERGWPGYLAEVSDAANDLRDEHFARVLLDLMGRGERVFAVAGSSHAVRLEPPLRAACAAS